MFAEEQAQLRTQATACWSSLDLHQMVIHARKSFDEGNPLYAHNLPSCVVMLLDDPRLGPCPQNVRDFVERRVHWFRALVEEEQTEFALGNQPQYVIDRVMASARAKTE